MREEESFAEVPPNAVLTVKQEEELRDLTVVLMSPVLTEGTLAYTVEVLDGPEAGSGALAALFIDVIGDPISGPRGEMRRTARRTSRRTARRVDRRQDYYDEKQDDDDDGPYNESSDLEERAQGTRRSARSGTDNPGRLRSREGRAVEAVLMRSEKPTAAGGLAGQGAVGNEKWEVRIGETAALSGIGQRMSVSNGEGDEDDHNEKLWTLVCASCGGRAGVVLLS